MSTMKINFADVEGSFEALPEGAYPVVIEKVERRESKSSEHDYLNWELTVTDGEHKERKLWMITSLSPRALWKLKDVLDALGYDTEGELDFEFDEGQVVEQSQGPLLLSPQLAGEPAIAVVKNELYNEKERNRVEELVAAAPPGPKKTSSSGTKKAGGRKLR